MKRCFLVVGPESAGNRLLTSILVRAGCHGDGATFQAWDEALPFDESPAAVIRSYPHGEHWPDLAVDTALLRARGYDVVVLITVREIHALTASQLAHGHVETPAAAHAAMREAYERIFDALLRTKPRPAWFLVPYESLVLHPEHAAAALLATLSLPSITWGPLIVEGRARYSIENQNAKHYQRPEARMETAG